MKKEDKLKIIAIKQLDKLITKELGSLHPELKKYLQEVGAIEGNQFFPVKAAIALVKIGVSVERTAKLLNWKEFESLCEEILNSHGYSTIKHLRFSFKERGYEIDLLALSSRLMLSIDCKRWSYVRKSSLLEAALRQKERTEALSQVFPSLKGFKLTSGSTNLIPMVICWIPEGAGVYQGIPIVPLHSFNSYLIEFDPLDSNILRKKLPWKVRLKESFLK